MSFFSRNLSLLHEVALVAHEHNADIIVGELLDFLHPLLDIIESLSVGHIKNYDDSVCASVVARCEGPKPFLARSVPYLKLDVLLVHFDILDLEVHSDGVEEVLVERILGVSHQQATLSHATVSDQQHFEQEVAKRYNSQGMPSSLPPRNPQPLRSSGSEDTPKPWLFRRWASAS